MKQNSSEVRVRFAPSPTGHLHIGGLRTALFNWLFARHHGGKFVIRIEDTDLERSKPEYTASILEAFAWAGMTSDEPLVFQTQRFDLYKEKLEQLIANGSAYYSDPAQEENGKSVIRFRVPRDQKAVVFDDLIYGRISFDTDQIDDFVIARADGSPLYNFVVVVDDIAMRISHIIRADEHIPNTPRQLLLYQALGVTPPLFAHVSMIFGPSGKPLSKRDASTSVLEYRADGYLPDALCNYLVRLGWSHGDKEILSKEELIQIFSLKDINKSGAMFDAEKLLWVNGVYMRAAQLSNLLNIIVTDVMPDFKEQCHTWSEQQLLMVLGLYRERVATLKELARVVERLHNSVLPNALPDGVAWDAQTVALLNDLMIRLQELNIVSADEIKKLFAAVCADYKVALPVLAKPVRFALTGVMDSPSVFHLVELLGVDETSKRLELLKNRLSA